MQRLFDIALPRVATLALLAAACVPAVLFSPPARGAEDVPYWVSLKVEKANMRVGPGGNYRIAWVYQREGLPLKVVRRLSGWRLVEDPDGARGWIVSRFLSTERTAIVNGEDLAPMRARPDEASEVLWRAEAGVVGMLGDCEDGWCRFAVDEREGWVTEDALWGAGAP